MALWVSIVGEHERVRHVRCINLVLVCMCACSDWYGRLGIVGMHMYTSIFYSSLSQSYFPLLCCLKSIVDLFLSLLWPSLLSLWPHDLFRGNAIVCNANCVVHACQPSATLCLNYKLVPRWFVQACIHQKKLLLT